MICFFVTEREKTLEESAREYQATHKRETELEEVEVVTGEENESNVLQVNDFNLEISLVMNQINVVTT